MASRWVPRPSSRGAVLIATTALILLVVVPLSSQAQGVCDAYQQLLNQTKFEVTPFCGRPDDGPVPGFTPLKRHYWGVKQIWPIFLHVYEFMLFDNQFHVQMTPSGNPKKPFAMRPLRTADLLPMDDIAQFSRLWMRVWGYEEPIDIENDGSPLNVLIWQGYGANGASDGGGRRCGSDYAGHPWTVSYADQRAFIINADGKTINEQLTRAIFGAPEESTPARLTRQPSNSPFLPVGANPFRPLADTIGIFEYHGRYYIETENMPKTKNGPLPPVVVYLRERDHTTRVCTIELANEPVPVD